MQLAASYKKLLRPKVMTINGHTPYMGVLKSVISQLLKVLAQSFWTYTPIFGNQEHDNKF